MDEPVAPVLQLTVPLQLLAVSIDCPPAQMEPGDAESVGAEGIGLTVRLTEPLGEVHPFSEQVAV